MAEGPEKLIRPEIRALQAYAIPRFEGPTKLDAMENPYEWIPELIELWDAEIRVAGAQINRYPDPQAEVVKTELRRVMSIPEHLQIVLGNGSDELIQLLALAVAAPDATILAPEPSFVMYKMIAAFTGMRYLAVELDESFDLDVAAMLAALDEHQPELVFFAQPNNPTGNVYSEERLRQVVAACSGIVVLDEAYTPFTDADFLSWVDEYPNVVVMRTLSKVGLAGLRLGIMIGRPALMSEIDKLRLPYNISVLTQASAAFALRHYPVFEAQANEIRRSRELLKDAVNALPGLECWESEANFLLVYCRNHDPVQLHSALKLRGILVKNLHGSHPRLAQCLRLTVGTPAENESLLSELGQLTG